MGYEYITKYNSPNYTKGRTAKISGITIHHWGNDGLQFQPVINYLCRLNGDSSAHYVVEAGKVACIVDPDDTAWHAGNWAANCSNIGIECRPECRQGDLETVAELIADLRKTYGNLPLYPHKKWTATACPGRWEAKLAWLNNRANEILKGGTQQAKPQTPAKPSSSAFNVKVDIADLRIRKGAGTNYAWTGSYTGKGTFTITEVKSGQGSKAGWGRLKSGAGWIALDYAKKVNTSAATAPKSFKVQVSIPNLYVRKGAGTNYGIVQFCPMGVYTITEVKSGQGSSAGWGRLKSGLGWVSLDYAKRV